MKNILQLNRTFEDKVEKLKCHGDETIQMENQTSSQIDQGKQNRNLFKFIAIISDKKI